MELLFKLLNCRRINLSLAAFPGYGHFHSMQEATALRVRSALVEPLWGELSLDHVQVVPQNHGVFGVEEAARMRNLYPNTNFRLHANVWVADRRAIYDLSSFLEFQDWFRTAGKVQAELGGICYSAHAGYRDNCRLEQMFDNARRAADLFDCPVAIEGLYPDRHKKQLLATWPEYRKLLDSGLPFALDLSHLNIVAKYSREFQRSLVIDLLSSPSCLEIHVSSNDGYGDQHQVCQSNAKPWWFDLLSHANPNAVIFTEGNLRRHIGASATQVGQ